MRIAVGESEFICVKMDKLYQISCFGVAKLSLLSDFLQQLIVRILNFIQMVLHFYKILLPILLLCLALPAEGQQILQPKQVEENLKGIIYKREKTYDIRWHENGFAFAYNTGKIVSYDRTNYYMFELGYTKDHRERRINRNLSFGLFNSSRSFSFGKINSLINLRAGVGKKVFKSEKAKRKGIAVGYNIEAGPSLAILKPYYLELIYVVDAGASEVELRTEKFTEDNAEKFLSNDVYGSSGFFRGLTEIGFTPGIQGKAGLLFSLGAFDKYAKALEVGIQGDLFIKKIDILTESENIKNRPYFLKFYLKFEFGIRSN